MITSPFNEKCLAIDLEVGRETARIHRFAAIRGDRMDQPFVHGGGKLDTALQTLDDLTVGADFVSGHNVIAFDLPHLRAVAPQLRLLSLPAVDTLRLSPLAFPRHPYHRLVKHYKDGGLIREFRNDPELDTRISLQLLEEEETAFVALRDTNPQLLAVWHWLLSRHDEDAGFVRLFDRARALPRPGDVEGRAAVAACLEETGCLTATQSLLETDALPAWPLSYALAWLSVAGSNSVMPPWVRHEFPEAGTLVRNLRDVRCGDTACRWCEEHHHPGRVLRRWFGFSAFRPEPACEDGRPMQEAIVEAAMSGAHVLGILPTGTGKSVCYQLPALSRYVNTGALTIIISPLVALMADQVYGLHARGIPSVAALNGLLSMPERADVLERVRLGDIAMLLVSPEQLRNRGFRKTIEQREIGAWVLDEAHCLSKWGHDFRTDYRYVGRFIREKAGEHPPPPVLCLTATAKPDVIADIQGYFLQELGQELRVFNGGANRTNLEFAVMETTPEHKLTDLHALLENALSDNKEGGGAIIYCATRKQTELVARSLTGLGWAAAHFHAGLSPERKKDTQQQFISSAIRVIAATNAFGMGIDKPDVRLVVHGEIPGSLENYMQEAGRAGRDQEQARCVLLYCEKDIEQQFGLSALSRLPRHEIQAVLRALRRLRGKHHPRDQDAVVVATPGEILSEDEEQDFCRDSATDDTRVRTAVSWLEEARLARREENRYEVFPSTLRVPSLEEAEKRLAAVPMPYRGQLRAIVLELLQADPAEGVSTDELMGVSRLSSSGVAQAMHTLEQLGLLSNDAICTALVHSGVEHASLKRLETAVALETALIATLREEAPDLEKGAYAMLNLRRLSQRLKDAGHNQALPERLYQLLQGIASDGRSDEQGIGSFHLRKYDAEVVQVTLQRDWEPLQKTSELRKGAAVLLLHHLLSRLPQGLQGVDLEVETTLGNLYAAVESDLLLKTQVRDLSRLVERALLWLHEQDILRLGRGMIVFKPAMTIHVAPGKSSFTRGDYAELQDHYHEQVVQIHVMAEYARQGLAAVRNALQLASDYFTQERESFIKQWFPETAQLLSRQTTNTSWAAIVDVLNRVQRTIVTDEREQTNLLVLAGPGSGKTRVLVHRIAFLVRVRRERPRSILALAYNRHAAVEIRRRLRDLIGDDAAGVTVLTCHALAMRLTGTSFVAHASAEPDFEQVLVDAVRLLKGIGLPPADGDEHRERLMAGFRWILVDEYQDIGREQYELISALAGRTLAEHDKKLSLFAVGDDDQNIYAFGGASVRYIRQFQHDYRARTEYLVQNYRSTAHIIHAANAFITHARERMKSSRPIEIDAARTKEPLGDRWETLDPVARGAVQCLAVEATPAGQAAMVMGELQRLAACDPAWDWSRVAVIAREWRLLDPVQTFCELNQIPAQRADRDPPQFWRLRETQHLATWLSERGTTPVDRTTLQNWLATQPRGPWWELLAEAMEAYHLECGDGPLPALHFREWLAEWGREIRRQQRGIMLATAHRVKGLEFDHAVVLDGAWDKRSAKEDPDASRRLYYVAMTRARQTLTLAWMQERRGLARDASRLPGVLNREAPPLTVPSSALTRRYEALTPGDVDLGYAGRTGNANVRASIAELQPDDPLELVTTKVPWVLTHQGRPVGRLAKKYAPPAGICCVGARVRAVLTRFQTDGNQSIAITAGCDRWEVVLPELIFAPEDFVHEAGRKS